MKTIYATWKNKNRKRQWSVQFWVRGVGDLRSQRQVRGGAFLFREMKRLRYARRVTGFQERTVERVPALCKSRQVYVRGSPEHVSHRPFLEKAHRHTSLHPLSKHPKSLESQKSQFCRWTLGADGQSEEDDAELERVRATVHQVSVEHVRVGLRESLSLLSLSKLPVFLLLHASGSRDLKRKGSAFERELDANTNSKPLKRDSSKIKALSLSLSLSQ